MLFKYEYYNAIYIVYGCVYGAMCVCECIVFDGLFLMLIWYNKISIDIIMMCFLLIFVVFILLEKREWSGETRERYRKKWNQNIENQEINELLSIVSFLILCVIFRNIERVFQCPILPTLEHRVIILSLLSFNLLIFITEAVIYYLYDVMDYVNGSP